MFKICKYVLHVNMYREENNRNKERFHVIMIEFYFIVISRGMVIA